MLEIVAPEVGDVEGAEITGGNCPTSSGLTKLTEAAGRAGEKGQDPNRRRMGAMFRTERRI